MGNGKKKENDIHSPLIYLLHRRFQTVLGIGNECKLSVAAVFESVSLRLAGEHSRTRGSLCLPPGEPHHRHWSAQVVHWCDPEGHHTPTQQTCKDRLT